MDAAYRVINKYLAEDKVRVPRLNKNRLYEFDEWGFVESARDQYVIIGTLKVTVSGGDARPTEFIEGATMKVYLESTIRNESEWPLEEAKTGTGPLFLTSIPMGILKVEGTHPNYHQATARVSVVKEETDVEITLERAKELPECTAIEISRIKNWIADLKNQLLGRERVRAAVQKNYEQHEAGVEQGYLRTVEALEKEIDRLKQAAKHYRRVGNQLRACIHEEAAQAKQIQLQQ